MNKPLSWKNSQEKILVVADYYRIYQVLKNLVTNAIKYSKEYTSVSVYIKKRKKVATIYIEDQGKGIAKNHRKRVFERFYRVEKSRSKERGGTWLGLAISKHIIEGHKTKIKLKSKVNFGSIFSFNLKLLPKKIKKRKKIAKTLN